MAKKPAKNTSVKSIYDLAEQTGLATSTISRVLNQRGRISESTRQRVLAAARQAGFRPKMSARQTVVAIVLDRLRYAAYGGFANSMLANLVDQLAERNVAVEVYTERNVPQLGNRFIDGVVAMSWEDSTIEQLSGLADVPVVLINRLDQPHFAAVASDHYQCGQLVASHLLEQGHRKMVCLAEEKDWGAAQRIEGMRDTLRSAGTDLDEQSVAFTGHEPCEAALRELLKTKPTALFLAGEDLALEGVFAVTRRLNVQVPQQLAIIGLESPSVCNFTAPPLTTVVQPLAEIARRALDLVLSDIAANRRSTEQVLLQNTLAHRESS